MASNINRVSSVSVERVTASVQAEDFSTPAVAAYFSTSISNERKLTFSDPDEYAADFPASGATEGINRALGAFFSQNPRPENVALLRLASPSTKIFHITPTAANSKAFKLKVNGTEFSYTSDSSATVQEIVEGWKAVYDAGAISGVTCTEDNLKIILTGTAGLWFSVELTGGEDDGVMVVSDATADPGIAADLTAVNAADPDWYAFTIVDGSEAIIDAASSWAESNEKFFVPTTQDSDCLTSATDCVLSTLKTATRERTLPFWHHNPREFPSMALMSRVLATRPGKRAFYHKKLTNVSVSSLSTTQMGFLDGKYANYYIAFGALNRTEGGKVSGNEWGDIMVGADYWASQAQSRQATLELTAEDKIDGDEGGIGQHEAVLRGVALDMVGSKFARLDFDADDGWPDQGYGLTVPTPDDIDPDTRELDGLVLQIKINGGIKKTSTTIRLVA
jgi:hypothetical protein